VQTRLHLSKNQVGGGKEDEASLDTNILLGITTTLGNLGREIQILAGAESLPDAATADVPLHLCNVDTGGNDDTSRASTITQGTFNSYVAGEGKLNSSDAG
jgi:hypothetical protein